LSGPEIETDELGLLLYTVCLVPRFKKKLGFNLSFCKMKLNTIQNFWQRYLFFILDFGLKRSKKLKSSHQTHEKFDILDETKRTYENFDILHFIIPK
jgi:hypothetical protein